LSKLELRNVAVLPELRAEGDGSRLVGYASRFSEPVKPYLDWPEFTEIVGPDAFTRTLRERPDVRAVRNHDPNLVLARGKNGTLRLVVDRVGLAFDLTLNLDTSLGRDTRADVTRGDIDGCSIGFMIARDDIVTDRDTGIITRTLLDVDLIEITPACTFPANERATVEVRSLIEARVGVGRGSHRLALARRRLRLLDLDGRR